MRKRVQDGDPVQGLEGADADTWRPPVDTPLGAGRVMAKVSLYLITCGEAPSNSGASTPERAAE